MAKAVEPCGRPGVVAPSRGITCTGEIYKKVVKRTFARGAARAPPVPPPASSTPSSKAAPGARSTSMRATRSMNRR
jgi:hypothetical protein